MELSLAISILSITIVVITFARNVGKDKRAEVIASDRKIESFNESLLKANIKLDQICATTNETRTDIKALEKKVQDIETRVFVLERDTKTAFNKIDDARDTSVELKEKFKKLAEEVEEYKEI